MQQQPLPIALKASATFDNFYAGQNHAFIEQLKNELQLTGFSVWYIWGEPGAGRSHCLQACCHFMADIEKSSCYYPLDTMKNPDVLQGLENIGLVALDNIDAIINDSKWEEALFHLYNRIQATSNKLIVSGDKPPRELGLTLPDLTSRLSYGLVYKLKALNDDEKIQAATLHAERLGLNLPQDITQFLIRRVSRDMPTLWDIIAKLDKAVWHQKRPLTIPFVKEVLGI